MYLQIYQIKKHLNIDEAFHEDDEYLASLAEAAEKAVEVQIDRPLDTLKDGEGYLPSPLVQAILLLVGTWYASRESVTFGASAVLPHGFEYIIALYKKYDKEG